MSTSPAFDAAQAHKYFSADYFNRAWELIDKPWWSSEEDERMLLLTLASLWHWTQRKDCTLRETGLFWLKVSAGLLHYALWKLYWKLSGSL